MSRKNRNKKPKKGKHLLLDDIVRVLKGAYPKPLNYKQVCAELNIVDHSQRLLVNAIMEQMGEDQAIEQNDRGKFRLKSTEEEVTGKIEITQSGSAFIIVEDREDDIFVGQSNIADAIHGDTVKVKLFPKRGRRREGEVVEIVKRGRTEFVGTVQLYPKFAFLVPDNQRMGTDIYIPLEKINKAKAGQKAIARITKWPSKPGENPAGEITEVLGNPGEIDTEIHAILAEYGLPYIFPNEVERAADEIPVEITAKEIAKRRDFRTTTTFTIDPYDAKDFDDALSIKKLDNGNWEIGVHIADVSHYVTPDTIIDKEGYSRATSVYLVDRVVPMLPEILSNNVCSLRPNEDKLCFSAVFEIDEHAKIIEEWFGRTVIRSIRRFTYEEAQEVIETGKGDFKDEILTLDKLAKKLRADRFKKGGIAFDKMEVKFKLDSKGVPTGVFLKQQKDSNRLIEDFMLLANRRVAEFIGKPKHAEKEKKITDQPSHYGKPFVYRIHNRPDPDKLLELSQFVTKFGYKIKIDNDKAVFESMNKLLNDVKGKAESSLIELLAVRTMAKAVYSTKNIGHYGLSFDHYTHFTSPIRRYPDVMVHRLLQHYLDAGKAVNNEELEFKCKHSSEMEKLAADAERSSIRYMQVQFLKDKIGEQFDGVISGVTEWGIFIELDGNHCEGMIRMRDMKDDMYYFDEPNYRVVGKRHKKIYTLGDKVLIEVRKADLIKKQLDFAFVDPEDRKEPLPKEKLKTRPQPKESKEPKKTIDKSKYDDWDFEF